MRAQQDRNSIDRPFNSSSNQNYVGTKFSCLTYDLQCTYIELDKTYNTTMRPAKTPVSLCINPLYKASFLHTVQSENALISQELTCTCFNLLLKYYLDDWCNFLSQFFHQKGLKLVRSSCLFRFCRSFSIPVTEILKAFITGVSFSTPAGVA